MIMILPWHSVIDIFSDAPYFLSTSTHGEEGRPALDVLKRLVTQTLKDCLSERRQSGFMFTH